MGDYYDRAGNVIDQDTWMKGFGDMANKRVAATELEDGVNVSTVWLGLDHGWGGGSPLIFETMVFGGEHDQWQDRYSTEEQAQAGHDAVVAWLRGEGPEPHA